MPSYKPPHTTLIFSLITIWAFFFVLLTRGSQPIIFLSFQNHTFSFFKKRIKKRSRVVFFVAKILVENSLKNRKKFAQKVLDISIFGRYNRGSFWIKKLFKRQKQKFIAKKLHTLIKSPVPRSFRTFSMPNWYFLQPKRALLAQIQRWKSPR